MASTAEQNRARLFERASAVIAVTTIVTGLLVILGWIADIKVFKSVFFAGFIEMKFNTALCFVLTGTSLWLAPKKSNSMKDRAPAKGAQSKARRQWRASFGLSLKKHLQCCASGKLVSSINFSFEAFWAP